MNQNSFLFSYDRVDKYRDRKNTDTYRDKFAIDIYFSVPKKFFSFVITIFFITDPKNKIRDR